MAVWEDSDGALPTAAHNAAVKPAKSRWEGEDEEESSPASDWEESSEEEEQEESKPAPAPVAPPKKKGTLKAKLAEKEAAKASRIARSDGVDVEYDEDAVLDPSEKARLDKQREISADLENTATLFGAAGLGGSSSKDLDALLSANPRTKEDFQALSAQIIEIVIGRHQNKPLYPAFVEHHVRQLAEPLRDVEVRKAASVLTTLANEKQKEQREKASGKKKPKSTARPTLGAAKVSSKIDTEMYDEALDDFGKEADDFM